eukprot:14828536-Ditylum_brightwellii.AAC.1
MRQLHPLKEAMSFLLPLLLLLSIGRVAAEELGPFRVAFFNELPFKVELFWEHPDDGSRHSQGIINGRGGTLILTSYPGHHFVYDALGSWRSVEISPLLEEEKEIGKAIVLAGGQESIRVRCETSVKGGTENDDVDILVQTEWSPWGA